MPNNSPQPALVRRAVVPAAGRGTRMQELRGVQAKELLAVAGRPLIVHALSDLAAAGVTDALVVVSPDKSDLVRALGRSVGGVALSFSVQERADGLADALSLAEAFTAGEPFFCWLPDNLWRGATSASAQVAEAYARFAGSPAASHFVALYETPRGELTRYGSAGFVESTPVAGACDLVRIDRVLPKGTRPDPGGGPLLKGFPLDLYQHDLFDRIRRRRAARSTGELDDTPLLVELATEGRLHGVVLRGGELFDCGIPDGYRHAVKTLGA